MNAINDIEHKLRISSERQRFAVGLVGGPTTVIDVAGRRIVIDPTFDPPGDKGYLKKTEGPAVSAVELGKVDVVLVSHDQHSDNLDELGRTLGLPTVYLSGDNASLDVVSQIAERWTSIDVAVLFAGAARVPTKERARPLTLTSARAAAAAELLNARVVIPSHYRGWAHFTEGEGELRAAFDDAGFSHVLRIGEMGQWIHGLG